MHNLKVYGHKNLPYLSFDMSFVEDFRDGRIAVAEPIEMVLTTHDRKYAVREPSLRLDLDTAQNLFQVMWDEGFRPAQGSSGKAEVDALQKHIAFAEQVASTLLRKT